jgi:hypothetical protein
MGNMLSQKGERLQVHSPPFESLDVGIGVFKLLIKKAWSPHDKLMPGLGYDVVCDLPGSVFDIPATSQHQEFSAFSVNSLTANHH